MLTARTTRGGIVRLLMLGFTILIGAQPLAFAADDGGATTLPAGARIGDYVGSDVMIPMRDGVRLHAQVWRPAGATGKKLPLLMQRSPYGFTLERLERSFASEYKELAAEGFIFVLQDIRGRFGSEGEFVMLRPKAVSARGVDESTDTYDSIAWLTKSLPDNNGKAGVFGISYGGWTAAMATINPHPALKAVSVQASPEDMYLGDDFHHNGAFRLQYGWEYSAALETDGRTLNPFEIKDDAYTWYLQQGELAQMDKVHLKRPLPTWQNFVGHPNYDAFWREMVTSARMSSKVAVPNLIVAGWWDQEDFYGPLKIYQHQERGDAHGRNFLVIGPWNHGGWARGDGDHYGPFDLGSTTSVYFRSEVQTRWFRHWLKNEGTLDQAEALVFQTGSNQWQRYRSWPPTDGVTRRNLYLRAGGKLSFTAPDKGSGNAPASFVSDPANPVPYRVRPIGPLFVKDSTWPEWLADDQAPFAQRQDVLSWSTDALEEEVTIVGNVTARIFASTTGSDADWVVKLIDVYPSDETVPEALRGRQLMVANDVFRARFRSSYEKPQLVTPNAVIGYDIDLHAASHVFRKGHRIAVQVQSSWFPLIDRNPQNFVANIFAAKPQDYVAQTHKVYQESRYPSAIAVGVQRSGTLSTGLFAEAATPALTRADVDAWLDGLVPRAMQAGDIAGGVVVIVKDGEILTERGFGYADVAAKIPVDPRTTVFRPGSISKVFTWTAVMQLVEQGKLDLDVDINRYLDFTIPPYRGQPVTMRNIMTHTTGWEEKLKDIIGSKPRPSLDAYVKEWIPQRIFAPGVVPAYSNYASALAGYIVERVSQQPFDDYMDRHLLEPLGMAHSTFRQPVPERLLPQLSKGYLRRSGDAQYFEYLGPGPAGSLSATGHDMGKFMIAHLQNGEYESARILAPETAIQMHAIQPKVYPALHGMALGFYEHSRNGHRVIAHNGGTQFFHSDLHLFLDDGVGLFISLNSPGIDGAASGLHEALFHGFADRYLPATMVEPVAEVDAATAAEHARLVAGTWEDSRRSDSSILRIFGLMGPLTISANDDGTISFPVSGVGIARWREVAPFVWRDVNGPDKIQVLTANGRPTLLGLDMAPPAAFQPAPAWRSPAWVTPALAISIVSLLISGLAWPIAAMVRRRFNAHWLYSGRAALIHRVSRALNLGAAVLFLAIVATLIAMASAYDRLSSTMDVWLLLLKVAAMCVFVAAVIASICDLIVSWPLRRSWFGKAWSINVAASCALVLWLAVVFNFANFSSNY